MREAVTLSVADLVFMVEWVPLCVICVCLKQVSKIKLKIKASHLDSTACWDGACCGNVMRGREEGYRACKIKDIKI